jgi:hypothetical protein
MSASIQNFGKNYDCLFGLVWEWKAWEFSQQSHKTIRQKVKQCKAMKKNRFGSWLA